MSFRAVSVSAATSCSCKQELKQVKPIVGQRLLFWLTKHKGSSQKAGYSYKAPLQMGLCLGHNYDALKGDRDTRTKGQAYRVGLIETGPQRKSIERV